MKKIVLFDVDGTLVSGNTAHVKAFEKVFKDIYGIDGSIEEINHHGLTDKILIRLILERHGIDSDTISGRIDLATERMVEYYKEYLTSYPVKLIEGAREFLEAIRKEGHLLGLVTGNLKGIARFKLGSVKLWDFFSFGGFGGEGAGMERSKLVEIALKKAENIIGRLVSRDEVYMFGDTPRDIEAAKINSVKAVGIAGGIYSIDDLKNAGAYKVYKNYKHISHIRSDLDI